MNYQLHFNADHKTWGGLFNTDLFLGLSIKHLLEVRFSLFEVWSSCYWGNSVIFSFLRRSLFWCHSDCHKMTIWPVWAKMVIAISWLLKLFLWFKVVRSCLLVCSGIYTGSHVSIMSHYDVTLVLNKWHMWRYDWLWQLISSSYLLHALPNKALCQIWRFFPQEIAFILRLLFFGSFSLL